LCPAVESSFQLNMKVEEAYSLIWKVLMELIKANLKIVREIPAPSTLFCWWFSLSRGE